MHYWILWFLLKFYIALFIKRLHVNGKDNIPKKKAFIIASNHPNSFLDAIIIQTSIERSLYYLVRSDMFNTPVKKFLLNSLHQLPVYRIQEGYANLTRNDKTFEACHKKLLKNNGILIFTEGIGYPEKKLRTLKKGTARLALSFQETYPDHELYVVPATLNYDRVLQAKSPVHLNFNKALKVSDYMEAYRAQSAVGIKDLTQDIQTSIEGNLIQVPNKEKEGVFDALLEMTEANKNHALSQEEQFALSLKFNQLKDSSKLESSMKSYQKLCAQHKKSDLAVANAYSNNWFEIAVLPVLMMIRFISALFTYLPAKIADGFVNKKVRQIEFTRAIVFALNAVLRIFNAVALYFIFAALDMFPVFLAFLLISWLSVPLQRITNRAWASMQFTFFALFNSKKANELIKLRKAVFSEV